MRWSSDRPLIIGHRGDSANALENTASAFESARRAGADGVELDVQRCASGELIVFHDETLDRLAGRAGRVDALPWSELREVELAGGERIPSFDDALDAIGPDLLVNVEIKASRARLSPSFVHAVARAARDRLGERALVSSFHPGAVAAVRRFAPSLATGLLFHAGQGVLLRAGLPALAIRPFAVHPEHTLVTPRSARAWRRRGFAVNTWTADHPAEVARLVRCGVGAIITNAPGRTRGYVERALHVS